METIAISDIAHSLSHICRFAGHTKHFYSVAQHSVLVADIMKDRGCSVLDQFHGLMHDATEAYLTDIPTPVKRLIPAYTELEDKFYVCIAKKFHLKPQLPDCVKEADLIALATEAKLLMNDPKDWNLPYPPANYLIPKMDPSRARRLFMRYFRKYVKELEQCRLRFA